MIIEDIISIVREYSLCVNCIGRQFALLTSGTTNRERGDSLLLSLAMDIHKKFLLDKKVPDYVTKLIQIDHVPIQNLIEKLKLNGPEIENSRLNPCFICNNILFLENLDKLAQKIVSHSQHYEFTSFLVGCKIPPIIAEKEEILRTKLNINFGEPLKSEFNRELGKIVGELLSNKEVNFKNPEILFIVDLNDESIIVKSNPLFIEGRYRKLVRGIPQSIWHCQKCRGKGCKHCDDTGRMYPDSVEEYITPYLQQAAKGMEVKLHCSGREDIDALMLGNGRPFVVEVSQPKKRNLDLTQIESTINQKSSRRIDITLTGISSRLVIRKLKGESDTLTKKYRMAVESEYNINWNDNSLVEKIKKMLIGKIEQQTPKRVLHRRADLIREKIVHDIDIKHLSGNKVEVEIFCQGGLYVKELMHGDDGRTNPSLSSIIECGVNVIYLDVLEVESISQK